MRSQHPKICSRSIQRKSNESQGQKYLCDGYSTRQLMYNGPRQQRKESCVSNKKKMPFAMQCKQKRTEGHVGMRKVCSSDRTDAVKRIPKHKPSSIITLFARNRLPVHVQTLGFLTRCICSERIQNWPRGTGNR